MANVQDTDLAGIGAGQGARMVGFKRTGTGAAARTAQTRLEDYASVKDFGAIGDGTTNDSPAFTAAIAAERFIFVPPGTYNLETMVELAALGVGGRTLLLAAGATLTRTTGAATTPIIWVRNSECAIVGQGKASIITSNNRHPEGLLLVGQRNLATAEDADVLNCTVSDLKLSGKDFHGATSGNPDKLLTLCSSHISRNDFSNVSFFNSIRSIHFEKANIGLHFLGDANGNQCDDLFFQWIGNPTLSAYRAAIYFEGGLENIINGFLFHSSPGSTAVRMTDCDNRANGGVFTSPINNFIRGTCEQDPDGVSGGKGLVANANCTATNNRIDLIDNCPDNDIGAAFARANKIRLIDSDLNDQVTVSHGFIADRDVSLPTDRTTIGIGVDTSVQEPYLRAIWNGADWRKLRYEARSHFFFCNGLNMLRVTSDGIALSVPSLANAADDTAAATAGVEVGEIYRNGSALMVRVS